MWSSKENINPKTIDKDKRLTNIVFFRLLLNKKINNNPSINKINGILFPESIMPTPKIHITNMLNINLRIFLSLNEKATKNIVKKEKFLIKLPAINSSPKKPEL